LDEAVTRFAAFAATALLLASGVVLHDLEAIAIALLLVSGVFLLRLRSGLVGRVVLALLFVDVIGWMAPALWSNATHGGAVSTLAVPLGLVASCVAGVAGATKVPVRVGAFAAAVVVVTGLVAGTVGGGADAIPAPSASVVRLSARGAQFSTSKLHSPSGSVAVVFHNKDLFWHTFTVDKLHVSLRAPLGATRVVHFNAPAGTYEFYCAIPGHKAAGMKGALVVS
jgi:plastocyanin